jgi:anhydro-N-acetylmuramic acid kinase
VTASDRFRAIGVMSGTSMDGIDAAFLETDGEAHLTIGAHTSTRYPPDLRRILLRGDIRFAARCLRFRAPAPPRPDRV